MSDRIPFNPMVGTEATIKSKDPTKGYVWFAKDTKKIFYSDGNDFLSMGGNSSIYYGNTSLKEPVEDDIYIFDLTEIDGNESEEKKYKIPNVDDLILNKDGCFYRVNSLIENEDGITVVYTKKLTLAGGGSSLGGSNGNILIKDSHFNKSIISGQKCDIDFIVEGSYADGSPAGDGIYTIRSGRSITSPVLKTGKILNFTRNVIDITDLIVPNKVNKMYITFSMEIGGTSLSTTDPKEIQISAEDVILKWDYDETSVNLASNSFDIKWSVSGINISKYASIIIDDMYVIDNIPVNQEYYTIENPSDFGLTHGAHKITLSIKVVLDEVYGDTLTQSKMFIMREPNVSDGILSVGLYDRTFTQYNTVFIPIIFYALGNMNNATITLIEDEVIEKDKWENVANCEKLIWPYTPTTPGIHTLTIKGSHGAKEIRIPIEVLSLDITNEEVKDYAFKFNAKDFASNNAVENWSSNNVKATFKNFDWINGGLKTEKDENGNTQQLVCIKAGSSMTINYDLFKELKAAGKCFKIIFKATKCRDYDASFLKCKEATKMIVSDNENAILIKNGPIDYSKYIELNNNVITLKNPKTLVDLNFDDIDEIEKTLSQNYVKYENKYYKFSTIFEEDSILLYPLKVEDKFIGLEMKAQSTEFISLNSTADGAITVPYCEDSYIEFELDISQRKNNKGLIKTWLDGIPASIQTYTNLDIFTHNTSQGIEIGSKDCDIYIYMIKAYERGLTNDEHLQNFIADAPNGVEMVSRFRRNDIMDKYREKEISPEKLAKANPNCRVHVYTVENMVQEKDIKVKGCTYRQYHGSDTPIIASDNCTIEPQGTSSMAYGIAAFNIDTDFVDENDECTLYDSNGKMLVDGWSMNENSIPCTYFNTKVNVASSEQANNALNQEWYHRFQPYKSMLRCKQENARDTMEFVPGVLFIQDNNKTTNDTSNYIKNNIFKEIDGYVSNPYPKLYSICNMGNSKKNVHVLHDKSNPKECCVEVSDNQSPYQWMTDCNYQDNNIDPEEGSNFEEYFSFRFPRKIREKVSEEDRQKYFEAWRNFVTWMAKSNPQPMYEELTIRSEEEFNAIAAKNTLYTFDKTNSEAIHEEINEYNSEIQKYYKKTSNIYGYTEEKLAETDIKSFSPYTFRGYVCDPQVQKNYTPLIKDYTISTYSTMKQSHTYQTDENGDIVYDNEGNPIITGTTTIDQPYTHDTYEYRMAKMLSECEDHLVMDSVLYHYLFIERHCMIDNVAKNTFWSTEDLQHWNLIKNYDNDTADGNDNNGKFTRNYGMEPTDDLNNVEKVFNASQSVWFNFMHGLGPALEYMYRKLEDTSVTVNGVKYKNAWDPKPYLEAFNNWQSSIPERCWIESYYRTYERPYEVYGDGMYLSMVMGGQKKHQRKQYETYQNYYMSSKYFGNDVKSSFITIRGSGSGKLDYVLPIKMYADCYVQGAVGSGHNPNVKIRAKRNQLVEFKCPRDNLNNTTFYLYLAYFISQLGLEEKDKNLSGFAPMQLQFASAPKLRILVLGTEKDSSVPIPDQILFNQNDLLEEVYVCNYNESNQPLDLGNSPNLRILDARGSAFTNIVIANNAPLQEIRLENPSALVFKNLSQIKTFDIESYDQLFILNIDNIDNSTGINSKDLVESSINGKGDHYSYYLNNVQWIIDNENDIAGSSILLLDELINKPTLEKNDNDRYSRAESLVGNLNITENAYSKPSSEAINIYNKYADANSYPYLDINFNSELSKLYKIHIYNGDNEIIWHRKIVPGENINTTFLSEGPLGAFDINNVMKNAETDYIYNFKNEWKVYRSKDFIKNESEPFEIINNEFPIYSNGVQSDLYIVPQFSPELRTYTVTFYDFDYAKDGKIFYKTLGDPILNVPVNTEIKDLIPVQLPYRNEKDLLKGECYKFMGYTTVSTMTDANPGGAINHKNLKVTGNMNFYPVFKKINLSNQKYYLDESAGNYFGPEKYFKVDSSNLSSQKYYIDEYDGSTYKVEGISIEPIRKAWGKENEDCRIVIPSILNGYNVVQIANFNSLNTRSDGYTNNYYTHIYCDQGSNLVSIGSQCFKNTSAMTNNLKIFDYPQSLRVINKEAFYLNQILQSVDFRQCINLKHIGMEAFNRCFIRMGQPATIYLPSSLQQIDSKGFSYLGQNLSIQIGSYEYPSLLDLELTKIDSSNSDGPIIQNTTSVFSEVIYYGRYNSEFEEITIKGITRKFKEWIGPAKTYSINPKRGNV